MKLLVTGYSGFVGLHYRSRFGGVPFEDQQGAVDLCDAERVRSAVSTLMPEAVLHLAAQSSVAASFEEPAKTFAVNFFGTLNLLQALSAEGFRGQFLYIGSADVYGCVAETDLPAKETQPLRPRSPYAVSKVAAEALCYEWSQTNGFRVVMTRPFTQIGPGQDQRFAVAGFARQIARIRRGRQNAVLTTGDLDVTRDFMDVRDTVNAYHLLLEGGENGEIYNICSGRERTLRSLVEKMLEIAGVRAEMKCDVARLRRAEQRRMVGDCTKIRERPGWEPQIPLEKTLTDILRAAEEEEDEQ